MISHLYFCDSFVNLLERPLRIAGRCLWALRCTETVHRGLQAVAL